MTAKKQDLIELLTALALVQEDYETEFHVKKSIDTQKKKELLSKVMFEVNRASKLPEPVMIVIARNNVAKLQQKLLTDNTKESVEKALSIGLLDEELRETLGVTILPQYISLKPSEFQTIRLNTIKKIRETSEKGLKLSKDFNSVADFIKRIENDKDMQKLSIDTNVIVEMTLELLGLI